MMRLLSTTVHPLELLAVAIAMPTLFADTSAAALSCQNIVLPMEDGATYKGLVRNEDYRFSAVIPPYKTGWGVREPAPFHGFIVFLDGKGQYREGHSCIDLHVGVRVVLPEDDSERAMAHTVEKPVTVGNRKGLEIIERETLGGRPFLVATVHLDLPIASGGSDYVSVTLISPADKYAVNRKIFDKFLSDLSFW